MPGEDQVQPKPWETWGQLGPHIIAPAVSFVDHRKRCVTQGSVHLQGKDLTFNRLLSDLDSVPDRPEWSCHALFRNTPELH
eukprot:3251930-Alexandrium_andersonii.AAC.2